MCQCLNDVVLKLVVVVFTLKHIDIRPKNSLCSGFHYDNISVSAHITLCAVVFTMEHIGISPYYTMRSCIPCETYQYQPITKISLSSNYRTTLPILLTAAIKRYMIAPSDDTKTKFIGEIVFELHVIW